MVVARIFYTAEQIYMGRKTLRLAANAFMTASLPVDGNAATSPIFAPAKARVTVKWREQLRDLTLLAFDFYLSTQETKNT